MPYSTLDEERYINRYHEIMDRMIRRMSDAVETDSISHDFIMQMIPHHDAAIEMSRSVLRYTQSESLRNIANDIIATQTQSIESMLCILECCRKCVNTEKALLMYRRRCGQITHSMVTEMKNARATGDIGADFLREMILHHRGAIRMSGNALRFRICEELPPSLRVLISTQTKRIQTMEKLLAQCMRSNGGN